MSTVGDVKEAVKRVVNTQMLVGATKGFNDENLRRVKEIGSLIGDENAPNNTKLSLEAEEKFVEYKEWLKTKKVEV